MATMPWQKAVKKNASKAGVFKSDIPESGLTPAFYMAALRNQIASTNNTNRTRQLHKEVGTVKLAGI